MKRQQTSPKQKPSDPKAKSVCFSLLSSEAHAVQVAGTFNNWNPLATPLTRQGANQWRAELQLAPGMHEYQFVVDGRWMPDPQAAESVPNAYGSVNSVVRVTTVGP